MDEERYPALPWQGWKIVKRLGRGGYGSVYLAQRNSAGVMEDAAVILASAAELVHGIAVFTEHEGGCFAYAAASACHYSYLFHLLSSSMLPSMSIASSSIESVCVAM